jgi:hypothetical protein
MLLEEALKILIPELPSVPLQQCLIQLGSDVIPAQGNGLFEAAMNKLQGSAPQLMEGVLSDSEEHHDPLVVQDRGLEPISEGLGPIGLPHESVRRRIVMLLGLERPVYLTELLVVFFASNEMYLAKDLSCVHLREVVVHSVWTDAHLENLQD